MTVLSFTRPEGLTRERMVKTTSRLIERTQADLDAWAKKFHDNPIYALEWSASVYDQAATNKVAQILLGHLTYDGVEDMSDDGLFDAVMTKVAEEVLRRARHDPSSTSRPSNMLERSETVAWANLADRWTWL